MPSLRTLQQRARIVQKIREFFIVRGYLELFTPTLSPTLLPESQLEVFALRQAAEGQPEYFLTPSPEYWMKQYIAKGAGDVFEICRSYRNVEEQSPQHSAEFTMLEWYTMGHDTHDARTVTVDLLRTLAKDSDDATSRIAEVFLREAELLTMQEAFGRYAEVDLARCCGDDAYTRECCRRCDVSDEGDWEVMFHRIFYHRVEPALPRDRLVFLSDYPARLAVLAEPVADTSWLDRWELYSQGVELANCYREETDPARIARYLEEEGERKKRCLVSHPVDGAFLQDPPLPRSSGVAMGIDRLVMQLLGKRHIGEVSILVR